MQIAIKIDEELYNYIQTEKYDKHLDARFDYQVRFAVKNGTPLPKGHGDIIDRSKIEYMKAIHDLKWGKITASECATRIKYSATTIIEADKERTDGNDD